MKVECELVTADWQSIIPALHAGAYDAIMAGMPITDEREKLIRFSDSYAAMPAYFAVLRSSDLAAFRSELERLQLDHVEAVELAALDTLRQAFAGRIVGVQVATPHADFSRSTSAVRSRPKSTTPRRSSLSICRRGAST